VTPVVPVVGWRVLDPDGNVVDSGPPMALQAVLGFGDLPPVPEIDPFAHVPLLGANGDGR